jgi:hypothetical protein
MVVRMAALRFLVARPSSDLVRLPWDRPLEEWDDSHLVPLARGISRHVVRFVRVGKEVIAIKETRQSWAEREYGMLRNLHRMGLPTVEAVGIVTGRTAPDGEPIEPALLTRHLPRSLPYRSLFSHQLQDDTLDRVVDALVVLMVRLHLEGFYWGDCSLSNTLFRRVPATWPPYLVDAETGELHHSCPTDSGTYDMDLLRTNVFGELLDLQAGGLLDPTVDAIELVDRVVERYHDLWDALTAAEEFDVDDMWRIEQRIEKLNALGFDVDELDIVTDIGGATVRIQPKVVEAGHHTSGCRASRPDVEEAQARRLLNDFDAYAASRDMQAEDPMVVAPQLAHQRLRAAAAAGPARGGRAAGGAELYPTCCCTAGTCPSGRPGDRHLRGPRATREERPARADRRAPGSGVTHDTGLLDPVPE